MLSCSSSARRAAPRFSAAAGEQRAGHGSGAPANPLRG